MIIELRVGFREDDRQREFWFEVPVPPEQYMQEHEAHMITLFQERVQTISPGWAVPILASTSQVDIGIAKTVNDTLEIWHTPEEWVVDNVLPVVYQAIPKEWLAFPGGEVFIAQALGSQTGSGFVQATFGASLVRR
jgi:hypothetical protein